MEHLQAIILALDALANIWPHLHICYTLLGHPPRVEVSCLTDTQNVAAYTKAPVQDPTRILITHLVVADITNKNQGTYFTSQNIQC